MRTFLTLIFLLIVKSFGFSQKLILSKINSETYVFTTFQQYNGLLFPSNGLLKITNVGVVIIDSPWDSTQFQPLLDSIEAKFHQKAVLCIATHAHEDRTGALSFFRSKGIPTYSSLSTKNLCIERGEKHAAFTFQFDTTFVIGNTSIQTNYPGAGHTPDNILVWFPKDKVLFGGCFVKSTQATDLGNLTDANIGMWHVAIKATKKRYKKAQWIIPGHQDWTNKKSLKHTFRLIKKHKKGLSKQLVEAAKSEH